MDMQGVPEACSWISLGMTGARMASPTEGSIAVLISVRKETACHGLGQSFSSCHLGALPGVAVRKQALHLGKLLYLEDLITFIDNES